MTTVYVTPKPPITSLRATACGAHVEIAIWVNGARAGSLRVRQDEVAGIEEILLPMRDDRDAAAFEWGAEGGTGLRWNPEAETAAALYRDGDLFGRTTLAELRAKAVDAASWADAPEAGK